MIYGQATHVGGFAGADTRIGLIEFGYQVTITSVTLSTTPDICGPLFSALVDPLRVSALIDPARISPLADPRRISDLECD